MKKMFLILTFSLLLTNLFGQEENNSKNSLGVALNTAFYINELPGANLSVEYIRTLNKYFQIVPKIIGGIAYQQDDNSYQSYSIFGAGADIRFAPFPKSFNRIKVDVGSTYQFVSLSSGSLTGSNYHNYYDISSGSIGKGFQFEIEFALSMDIIKTDKIEAGVKGMRAGSTNNPGLDSWQAGMYFNVKI